MKKIYIAGPDVFRPDAVKAGQKAKEICEKYGFEGCYPFDNEANIPEEIFKGNLEMIKNCDIIAANINNFRGLEPDSGTCFEIGFAHALRKKIYLYTNDTRTMIEKIGKKDLNGWSVEDFGKSVNLMIAMSAVKIIKGNFEDCIKTISAET